MNKNIIKYKEKYRPQFHFSPAKNWMNDPNGMVFYKGEYHLFYQYHPESTVWGPMHWGHAVSKDLISWEHLDIALKPDHNGYIFSGSAVVDKNDSSGLFDGEEGLVAIFTHADENPETGNSRQRQSLAYSTDRGRSWEMYKENPVLVDEKIIDFRDPKVYWFDEFDSWIMVVVAGDHARFYKSKNLIDWEYLSSFSAGTTDGVWECPDFFKLPVENSNKSKWVLTIDVDPGGPFGGSGAQYFIGDFDGQRFINDNPDDKVLWMDYGKDFYAGVTWSNLPESDSRTIFLAWMSNWQYAEKVPTENWRSINTIPRNLKLKEYEEGIRLLQEPVEELSKLQNKVIEINDFKLEGNKEVNPDLKAKCYKIDIEYSLAELDDSELADEFGIKVCKSHAEETSIIYNSLENKLYFDRRNSANTDFSEKFPGIYSAELYPENHLIRLELYIDWSSVEVFANDGKLSLTNLVFPEKDSNRIELFSNNGIINVKKMTLYTLDSIWSDQNG